MCGPAPFYGGLYVPLTLKTVQPILLFGFYLIQKSPVTSLQILYLEAYFTYLGGSVFVFFTKFLQPIAEIVYVRLKRRNGIFCKSKTFSFEPERGLYLEGLSFKALKIPLYLG